MRGPASAPPALLLAVAALPVTGLVGIPFLPSTPAGYLRFAVPFALLTALVAAAAWGRVRRPLLAFVVLAPFLAFGAVEAPSVRAVALPGAGVLLLAAAALVVAALPRARGAVAAGIVVLAGVDALLATASAGLVPPAWNPARAPLAREEPAAREPASPGESVGRRAGAPVPVGSRLAALTEGPGPWYERAARASAPGPGPFVLVLDGGAATPGLESDGLVVVRGLEAASEPLPMDAFDAVVVLPGAWERGDRAARGVAENLAIHVRRGGTLVGPGTDRPWPDGLARLLGDAAVVEAPGVEGARRLGLGTVLRVGSEPEARDVLRSRATAAGIGTRFDVADASPPAPRALEPWRDAPRDRRRQGILLSAYAGVVVLLERALREGRARLVGLLAPALAASLGVAWTSPSDPGHRIHAVALDLGGPGGRRAEALLVRAGPAGFRGEVRWTGGGIVSVRGGGIDGEGRVTVAPHGAAWVVRETLALGRPAAGDEEAVDGGFLRALVAGDPDPARLRFGRGAVLPVLVRGRPAPPAWSLVYRP